MRKGQISIEIFPSSVVVERTHGTKTYRDVKETVKDALPVILEWYKHIIADE